jgi:Mn2+/Fe2+ NRAMP family transporter
MTPSESKQASATIRIPEPQGIFKEPFSLKKIVTLLGFFGPAAMVASIAIGAGETILATGVGAWSEYKLLWLILISAIIKGVFVTYMLGRFTAVSGQPVGIYLAQLPGPRGWFVLSLVGIELFAVSFSLSAIAKPCGILVTNILATTATNTFASAGWENSITTLFLGLALGMSLVISYNILEKQQVIICGILVTGTILATLLVWPSVKGILLGTFSIGYFPAAPDWAPPAAKNEYWLNLVTVFGYVGGTLSPYLAYSSWVRMRSWGISVVPDSHHQGGSGKKGISIDYLPNDQKEVSQIRSLLSPIKWDVGMGALVLFVVTAAFLVAGAVVLYPRQIVLPGNQFDLLTKQSAIWAQIHPGLIPIYYISILIAMWGTLATFPEALTRFTHEFVSAVWWKFAVFPFRKLQTIIVLWIAISCCTLIWSDLSFDLLTQVTALLATNFGLALVCFATVYLDTRLPPLYRARRWFFWGSVISAFILFFTFAVSLIGLMRKL